MKLFSGLVTRDLSCSILYLIDVLTKGFLSEFLTLKISYLIIIKNSICPDDLTMLVAVPERKPVLGAVNPFCVKTGGISINSAHFLLLCYIHSYMHLQLKVLVYADITKEMARPRRDHCSMNN